MYRDFSESEPQIVSTAPAAPAAEQPRLDLNELFRKHHHHLLRFVQRYVRNVEDAKDVVQNTFLEATRCADRFSGLSKPSTWLFGIALNLARNQVRNHAFGCYVELDQAMLDHIVDDRADPQKLLEQRETAQRIETLLSGLQADIRATFEAVLDGDSTYEQAAHSLGIPIGTVRSRVSRVRMAVRAQCH